MTQSEYNKIQSELSELIASDRLTRKFPCPNYCETYKKAVLDCKSRLHNHFLFHNEEVSE